MANAYINIYQNNPTEGGTDGTAISTDGDYSAPLVVALDASQNESKIVKLAIRCEDGYETADATTITENGDIDDRWKLSLDSDTGWADSITFTDTIVAMNTIFWAKASSEDTEAPQRDRTVSFEVSTIVAAV